jgi:hypothetical protein
MWKENDEKLESNSWYPTEIWTQELPNKKQKYYSLNRGIL